MLGIALKKTLICQRVSVSILDHGPIQWYLLFTFSPFQQILSQVSPQLASAH